MVTIQLSEIRQSSKSRCDIPEIRTLTEKKLRCASEQSDQSASSRQYLLERNVTITQRVEDDVDLVQATCKTT